MYRSETGIGLFVTKCRLSFSKRVLPRTRGSLLTSAPTLVATVQGLWVIEPIYLIIPISRGGGPTTLIKCGPKHAPAYPCRDWGLAAGTHLLLVLLMSAAC